MHQVMKLQMLKEQVIKEMRQIKKTSFVGFPECTPASLSLCFHR